MALAIDLVRGLTKLALTDTSQRYGIIAKLLLPRWRVGQSDQITRPFVQLS